jgi:hypothetical protein
MEGGPTWRRRDREGQTPEEYGEGIPEGQTLGNIVCARDVAELRGFGPSGLEDSQQAAVHVEDLSVHKVRRG